MAGRVPPARSRPRRALVVLAAAALVAPTLAAPTARGEDAKQPWQPKAPEGLPKDFDWIRLKSDEWLKGKILSMYNGKLEFDSDELGVHTWDFADIKEVRSSRVLHVGVRNRPTATGRLILDGTNARVIADSGETTFTRAEILTIVVGAKREIDYEWYRDPFQSVANRWTVTAGLGYEIVDTSRTTWSVTAGPAWQSTDWKSAPAGDDASASSVALRIDTRLVRGLGWSF